MNVEPNRRFIVVHDLDEDGESRTGESCRLRDSHTDAQVDNAVQFLLWRVESRRLVEGMKTGFVHTARVVIKRLVHDVAEPSVECWATYHATDQPQDSTGMTVRTASGLIMPHEREKLAQL